ncbi:MAG: cytochrome c3 family protein, partial [Deltaproteobacteria bacterium]
PQSHTVFAEGFNMARTENTYLETDDFCFYCHSSISGQMVRNQDYSTTFGGAIIGSGPQSILDAFNQASYHNLYDITNFLNNDATFGPWFAKLGNPCSACHNSHLAKRNWDSGQVGFPLLSTISPLPDVNGVLWGETELMNTYFSYEAPFALPNSWEPAGFGEEDGGKTPDYISFCTSCHNPDKTIWSTTLNRELKKINFGNTGLNQEKHGAVARDGTDFFREPYATAAALKSNFILSCLDCHEPHGSENIMLLRRRINGENLEGAITTTDDMSYACKRCHTDDLAAAAGTNQANRWQYIHHIASDAPYSQATVCTDCHSTADGSSPVACGNCHGHGMDDTWAGANMSGRITF